MRREATGYGAVYFVERMLATRGATIEGKRAVVSGSGNVAIYTIEKIRQFGGKVVACSDSNGYVVDEDGIDLDLMKEIKEVRRERICEYARRKGSGSHYVEQGSIWEVPCDIAMPSATQNELTGRDARTLLKNGVVAVGEGANMPCTAEAGRIFLEAGVAVRPRQGRQRRRGRDLGARDAAERVARLLDLRADRGAARHDHAQHPRPLRRDRRGIRHAGQLRARRQHRRVRAGCGGDAGLGSDLTARGGGAGPSGNGHPQGNRSEAERPLRRESPDEVRGKRRAIQPLACVCFHAGLENTRFCQPR